MIVPAILLRYRPAVGWWDVLDIAIVSILIYELAQADPRHARGADGAWARGVIVGAFYVSRLAAAPDASTG